MRIAGIIKNSVVNGIGVRDVLFLQGCNHHCKGCHNPQTWATDGGEEVTIGDVLEMFKDSSNHITISGGEPLLQFEEVVELMATSNIYQNKRFWLYTGFKYEEIPPHMLKALAKYVDVLVDGQFEIDKKDVTLPFRGSSNQRLIDLPRSVREQKILLWSW